MLSLDGVAENPNRFFIEWDDVMDASIPRMIATQNAVIRGRRSYDEWVGFWPGGGSSLSDTPADTGASTGPRVECALCGLLRAAQ